MDMTSEPTDRVDEILRRRVIYTNAQANAATLDDSETFTVCVGGAVISGRLIPAWQWAAESGSPDTGPDEPATRAADLLRKEKEEVLTADEDSFLRKNRPNYLHLGWSHIFVGGLGGVLPGSSGGESVRQRIRLSAVDAWTFHAFTPRADDDAAELTATFTPDPR